MELEHIMLMAAAIQITRALAWLLLTIGAGLLLYGLIFGTTWFWALAFTVAGIIALVITLILMRVVRTL
jgi:hypothetical protein